jgi:hypothetical protein
MLMVELDSSQRVQVIGLVVAWHEGNGSVALSWWWAAFNFENFPIVQAPAE